MSINSSNSGIVRGRLATTAQKLFCIIVLLSPPAYALEADSQNPIEISADRAEIDEAKGLAIYTGNVLIEQGASRLQAHEVAVKAIDRQIVEIKAEGSPAYFEQGSQTKQAQTNSSEQSSLLDSAQGQANQILYNAQALTLSFEGDAKLAQGNNTFEGDQITYDIQARAIKAAANESSDSRVRIKYLPAAATEDTEPRTEHEQKTPAPAEQSEASNQ